MISTQAVVLGHPGVTSLKGVSAGERAQGSLRNGNERVVWRWSFSCFSQRARVDGRAEGPERSPAWESCLVCTEVPTLDRFGNYGEIGKVLHLLAHLCYAEMR